MLLQKTGLCIKRFISHKKKTTLEDFSNTYGDERFADAKLATCNSSRLSWLSQTSSAETTHQLRRVGSNVTSRSNRLTPQSTTAHSSASSLCSCDCESNPAPIEHSLFSAEPPPPHPDILYLPPLSDEFADGDAKTWHLIFQEPSSQLLIPSDLEFSPRTPSAAKFALESPFDVLGIFTIDLLDEDKTPTQSLISTGEPEMEESSEDVEQLIRETDKAFQAVGTALASAKAATRGWVDLESSGITKSSSLLRGPMKRNTRWLTSPLKPPARAISVSKKKRASKRKATSSGRSLKFPPPPPPPANTPTRWTLADVTTNMVDVFSGKMFRMEVDEMLTPGRIQQMKDKAESDRKISLESARSFETDSSTPKEPFHLESLSSRITAAQQQPPPFPSPVLPPPATPWTSPLSPVLLPSPKLVRGMDQKNPLSSKDSMLLSDYSFPAPPPPVPPRAVRRSSASRVASMLPTIPEVPSLNFTLTQRPLSTSSTDLSRPSLSILPPPAQIILPSTNFTLTSPLFRHGPIRLDRLVRGRKGSSPEEEALDWIAFQMAISGTILDDNADLRDDAEWEADEAEIDGIIKWYGSFGFQGYGRIESEADVWEREEATTAPKSIVLEKRQPEISYQQKRSWRGWTGQPPSPSPRPPLPRQLINNNSGQQMTGWRNDLNIDTAASPSIDPRRHSASPPVGVGALSIQPGGLRRPSLAESLHSLPPSPMLNIVVSGSVEDDEVPIPMGFNLGHDLGDFLNWEARHTQSMYVAKESE
ncbi:hypothetical protein QTJ16_003462 [Diplocarpon rosae]|uniref:Uncharacterized protein n=1 Tax=Diplocarpon rosae TaxID=946125 RepID=A0AAD9WFM5_9HELO|nr:hypothetical protein QTJ16_003462 [Diplocarpon rosae]PBP21642.1 hypothetical protein BUE80_DR007447 [Diplocarpon rosae]